MVARNLHPAYGLLTSWVLAKPSNPKTADSTRRRKAMRKYFLGVLTIALCLGGAALVRSANQQDTFVDENQDAVGAADGAFRDGVYQGQLAMARGSKPHVAIGRWASTQNRASFVAGYRKGYT